MPGRVLVPVGNGSEEAEAVIVVDVLRRAGADLTVASVDGLQVVCSRGTKLVADKLIKDCAKEVYDLIVLPGGMPGAEHLRDSRDLTELLKQQEQQGRLYAAICAAPVVVLQHHGLLGKRKAICHSAFAPRLENGLVTDQPVAVDGNCVTSRGVRTALDFALKLVELLFGEAKAKEIGSQML